MENFGPSGKSIELKLIEKLYAKTKGTYMPFELKSWIFTDYVCRIKDNLFAGDQKGAKARINVPEKRHNDWKNFVTLLNLIAGTWLLLTIKDFFAR